MKNNQTGKLVFAFLFSFAVQTSLYAQKAGTSSGMTLMETAGARPAALGEAFSAVPDDITGFGYNPASLRSLSSSQASFFYRTGMADDSYGQFMIGSPFKESSLGLSVGYFDGGKIDLYDGVSQRSVNVQRDLAVGVGYAFHLGIVDLGLAGKYLSSQLAEQKTATAYAGDAGLQVPLNSRMRFGSSIQNIGTQLKYKEEGDNLPRLLRSGVSFLFKPGQSAGRLLVDGVYDINNAKTYPALGLEQSLGPVSFRAGYKGTQGLNQFSFGVGLLISRYSFDYSFGMANRLDSMHLISLSMRFGSPVNNTGFSRGKDTPHQEAVQFSDSDKNSASIYVSKDQSANARLRDSLMTKGDLR